VYQISHCTHVLNPMSSLRQLATSWPHTFQATWVLMICRAPVWMQHAMVVLWALAAAHVVHYMSAAAIVTSQWQSPLVLFRTSGLQTLAIAALILRVSHPPNHMPRGLSTCVAPAMAHLPASAGPGYTGSAQHQPCIIYPA
jgi:hypothetical protein